MTPTAAVVLDGATQAVPLDRSGGWIAETLGRLVADGLKDAPSTPLGPLVEASLADLVAAFGLEPGAAPSTTVSIVRLDGAWIDVYVLCDSPVVVLDRSGAVHQVRDERLARLWASFTWPPGRRDMTDPRWVDVVERFEGWRNHPDGFWVASATPSAARYAIERRFPAAEVEVVVAATDGAAAGVDAYGVPATWSEAIAQARRDPGRFLAGVHATEEGDPDGVRWPRTKRHDDKAVAVIEVIAEGGAGS